MRCGQTTRKTEIKLSNFLLTNGLIPIRNTLAHIFPRPVIYETDPYIMQAKQPQNQNKLTRIVSFHFEQNKIQISKMVFSLQTQETA